MIFFDGTYRLRKNGLTDLRRGPDRYACAWRIRIIDLCLGHQCVRHLRPFIVVATPYGEGLFQANCAEHLGRSICRDFNLQAEDILWIEQFAGQNGRMHVAMFKPITGCSHPVSYHVRWRPTQLNELQSIKPFIPESEPMC